jgi:hypothetical protein
MQLTYSISQESMTPKQVCKLTWLQAVSNSLKEHFNGGEIEPH